MRKLLHIMLIHLCSLGTIHTEDSWLNLCMSAEPTCPNERITFWLYKNATRHEPIKLDPVNLRASDFEPRLPIKMLIHGFIGNRTLSPNLEVRDSLLATQAVHVVSVDYGTLVRFPCYYPWAVQNAPVVAKCVAQFLNSLMESGIYQREHIHLIGFSLGAQIAGLTANHVNQPLKRITGLDPAGPGFMLNDAKDKLDSSDADFVDVIHTDPFFFSLLTPMGHADFYPNLEQFNQPGCSYVQNWRFYNCNHYRAAIYYAESITTAKGFWALHCPDWLDFYMQRCNHHGYEGNVTEMGYFVSESARGSYFLSTHDVKPYAKGPLIDIEMDVIEANLIN